MPDSYLCPTCDHEAIVGIPCHICLKNVQTKKERKKIIEKPWEQDEIYDGLDMPDARYDQLQESEFDERKLAPYQKIGLAWYWWLTAFFLSMIWVFFMFQ